MTIALRTKCGQTKWGALNPCDHCGAGPSGGIQMAIAFSDHHFPPATLEKFGAAVIAVRALESDEATRLWTLLRIVDGHRPGFVKAKTPAGLAERVEELLRDPSVSAVPPD